MIDDFEDLDSLIDNSCLDLNIESLNKIKKKDDKLSVLNFNIGSLPKKYDGFLVLLGQLKFKFDIIVLTETWLKESNKDSFKLPGYESVHITRSENARGGGVSVFYNEEFNCEIISSDIASHSEFLIVSLNHSTFSFPIVVGGVYRPPKNDTKSIDEFLSFMNNLSNYKKIKSNNFLLCGDFNINLLDLNNNTTNKLLNVMYSFKFSPLITLPTRFATNSLNSSLIDHIWSNLTFPCSSGVLEYVLSDHYPTVTFLSNFKSGKKAKISISFRDFSLHNKSKFIAMIMDVDWFSLVDDDTKPINDVNAKFKIFFEKIREIYYSCFPIRKKNLSMKRLINPWLTQCLVNSIKNCHKYNSLMRQNKMSKSFSNSYRNKLNSLIKKVKSDFYKSKFQKCTNDIKATWKNINNLIGNKKQRLNDDMILGDEIFSGNKDICNAFSRHFTSTVRTLIDKIEPSKTNFESYLDNDNPFINSMFVRETNSIEVQRIISSFKNKNCDINNIPTRIYKTISTLVSPILAHLFNLSIENGIFPDCLKTARIIPIYKKDDVKDISNYRPIATLPIESKIFEKLMFVRLKDFIDKNKILVENQFGFRAKLSTSDALLNFVSDLYDRIDKNMYTIGTVM